MLSALGPRHTDNITENSSSFKENDSFSIKKIVGSTFELSAKKFFSLDKFLLKNMA